MSLSLRQSAAVVGGHCWAERRLFELLGHWSAQATDPTVALALDRHSQHAAWRGDQWWDRLPLLASLARDDLVVPGATWAALDGLDASAAGPSDDAASGSADVVRLAVAYRVALPRLSVAYARHEADCTPAADGAVRRTLGHVRPDIAADWLEGEALLEGLLVDDGTVSAAAVAVDAAERRFVA